MEFDRLLEHGRNIYVRLSTHKRGHPTVPLKKYSLSQSHNDNKGGVNQTGGLLTVNSSSMHLEMSTKNRGQTVKDRITESRRQESRQLALVI